MTTLPVAPGDRPAGRAGPRPPLGPLAALGLLLVILLTACGSAAQADGVASLVDPSATPDASPSASVDPEAAMEAFADCMREHGVDIRGTFVSAGGSGTGPVKNTTTGNGADKTGVSKDKFEAADKACHSLLPQGGVNGPGGDIDPAFEQKMLDFAKCMRDHGIDMPDPQFNSSGNGGTVTIGVPDGGTRIDPQSKSFKDAEAACGSFLPEKGTGGSESAVPAANQ
jgi:hypothetical protein